MNFQEAYKLFNYQVCSLKQKMKHDEKRLDIFLSVFTY